MNTTTKTREKTKTMKGKATTQLLLLAATAITHPHLIQAARDNARNINIINESGAKVILNWVHPDTGERVLQSNPHIFHGASFSLNSFATHTFEATEMPSKNGECSGSADDDDDKTCKVGFFTVNYNDEQSECLHVFIYFYDSYNKHGIYIYYLLNLVFFN